MPARNRCRVCGGDIEWYESTAFNGVEYDVLDAWWAHLDHPKDGHGALVDPTYRSGQTGP